MQIGQYEFQPGDASAKRSFRLGVILFFGALWGGAILSGLVTQFPKFLRWADTPINVTTWAVAIFGLVLAILGFLAMFQDKGSR